MKHCRSLWRYKVLKSLEKTYQNPPKQIIFSVFSLEIGNTVPEIGTDREIGSEPFQIGSAYRMQRWFCTKLMGKMGNNAAILGSRRAILLLLIYFSFHSYSVAIKLFCRYRLISRGKLIVKNNSYSRKMGGRKIYYQVESSVRTVQISVQI